MADNEWRWADPLGQQRLVRTDELRAALAAGVIAPNTPVWKTGWENWKPAYEVPELTSSALSNANGVVLNIPPPPLFIVAVQHNYEDRAVPPPQEEVRTEPPPPPRYVPSAAPPPPSIPDAPMATLNMEGATQPLPAANAARAGTTTEPMRTVRTPESNLAEPVRDAPETQTLVNGSPGPSQATSVLSPDDRGWDDTVAEGKAENPIPRARPSETLAGGNSPPSSGEDANTGVDISALSPADAERLLGIGGVGSTAAVGGASHPTVHGLPALPQPERPASPALPPPPPRRPSSIPPTLLQGGGALAAATIEPKRPATPMNEAPIAMTRPQTGASPTAKPPPRKTSRPPPPPPMRQRGQTLLLYGGAPPEGDPPADKNSAEPAPINVPAPGVRAPKAVTQAPPWNEGSAKVDPAIPKAPIPDLPPARRPLDSVEEITGSVLLAEDSSADVTQQKSKVEDLSASHLLPADGSGPVPQMPLVSEHAPAARTALGVPPAPSPATAPVPSAQPPTQPSATTEGFVSEGDGSALDELPLDPPYIPVGAPSPSHRLIHDLSEIWAQPERRWILGVAAAASLFVLLGLFGLIRLVSGSSTKGIVDAVPARATAATSVGRHEPVEPTPASESRGAGPLPSSTGSISAATAAGAATSTAACTSTGSVHVVAPKAQIRAGVESLALQNKLGLGFAIGEKEAMAVLLDTSSLTALAVAKQHTKDAIKRVVPILTGKGVSAAADSDRKGERISGARSVADASFVLGTADGKLVWSTRANETPHPIWPLESDGPVEAIRAISMSDGGYAVAFRQGAAIFVGAMSADKSANGSLSRVAGLGTQIGSPAIAASGDGVVVVWADHASASEPWLLRILRWQPGQAALAPRVFPIPPGGLGEQAMSPGIASVAGNRFLLSWTEGPIASHQVRAETLSALAEPLGTAMTISAEGVNAGQGQPAVLADGKGLVAYMASPAGGAAEVLATSVSCPLSSP